MRPCPFIAFLWTLNMAAASFGHSWFQTSAPLTNWQAIACSANGKKLVAVASSYYPCDCGGPIFVSSDSGDTWAQTSAPMANWRTIASSVDGTKLVAATGYPSGAIYASTNAGATWLDTGASNLDWVSIASSADGKKLIAAASYGGSLFVSTNSGLSWRSTSAPMAFWRAVASSADGTKLVGTGYDGVYVSFDSGGSWQQLTNAPLLGRIACSADGSVFAGALPISRAFSSGNSGETWETISLPSSTNWSLACSADGQQLIAASDFAIYVSQDQGVTWTTADAPFTFWSSVACSADGSKAVAISFNGAIYTSRVIPHPTLHLEIRGGNAVVSWLFPSSDVVLQQSSDVSALGWNDVTNGPVLNSTNLTYRAVLPKTGNSFFRLKH
jgi:hypothetical protein